MVINVFNDLRQSREEALSVLKSQAHSLLETIIISSRELLTAGYEVESEINKRLLNNAGIIKLLLEKNKLDDSLLKQIADQNNLNRINIFSRNGKLLYSSIGRGNPDASGQFMKDILAPIFNDETDTVIIGLREARMQQGHRYVAALATPDNGAIVLNLDAGSLLEFRKRIGFGILLNRLTDNEGVVYTALEDSTGILAASANISKLQNLANDNFNAESVNENSLRWRTNVFDGEEVFEAVQPFELGGEVIGMFKVGLSLTPLNMVNEQMAERIIISGALLLILGTFLIGFLFSRQNFQVLQRQYNYVEGFANQLIQNANDIIIVLDEQMRIKDINSSGKKFFGLHDIESESRSLSSILCQGDQEKIFNSPSNIIEIVCTKNNQRRHLLISRSSFRESGDVKYHLLIIKDLTDIKELEEQVARSSQLTAMGNLAAGVAHEIRNPLNTIGTIIQQLQKDFEPRNDADDYKSFTSIVHKEVKRINKTIESFLKLARPEPIKRKPFLLKDLLDEVVLQNTKIFDNKNIQLIKEFLYDGEVNWDENQIRQVMLNLIANAVDAVNKKGKIKISSSEKNNWIYIIVEDDGCGIPEENLDKIFNLYYTTKDNGTGIGLGIVQRIINEHDGVLTIDSKPGSGTTVTIKIKPE